MIVASLHSNKCLRQMGVGKSSVVAVIQVFVNCYQWLIETCVMQKKRGARILKFHRMNLINEVSFEEMEHWGVSWESEISLAVIGSSMLQNKSQNSG